MTDDVTISEHVVRLRHRLEDLDDVVSVIHWLDDILNLAESVTSSNESNDCVQLIFEGVHRHLHLVMTRPTFGHVTVHKAVELLQDPRLRESARQTLLSFCRSVHQLQMFDDLLSNLDHDWLAAAQ